MKKFLDGKKTYIGLIMIFISIIAKDSISEAQSEQLGIALFQLLSVSYTLYGNYKSHEKIKETF